MIELFFQNEIYPYDVYHMAKAFFPGEELKQYIDKEQTLLIRIVRDGQEIFRVENAQIEEIGRAHV